MADGGFLDYVKSLITDPSTGPSKGTPPVGTGGRQRQKAIDSAVEGAENGGQDQGDDKIGRMRQAQSTDRDNSYSY